MLGLGKEGGAVTAAVEERHLVLAAEGRRRDGTPEEDRPAEHEHPHDAQRISCALAERRRSWSGPPRGAARPPPPPRWGVIRAGRRRAASPAQRDRGG